MIILLVVILFFLLLSLPLIIILIGQLVRVFFYIIIGYKPRKLIYLINIQIFDEI